MPTEQVDLIDDEDGNFLNITSILPASAHSVPLLWCGDDEVRLHDGSHVWSHITGQFHHPVHRNKETRVPADCCFENFDFFLVLKF